MPKLLIISTTMVNSGTQTIAQLFVAKQRDIDQLKTPKTGQTEQSRLEDLLSCLHITKKCLLQVVDFVIETADEDDLISWRAMTVPQPDVASFANHDTAINLGGLPPPLPPQLPTALRVKVRQNQATQMPLLELKYTLEKLLSVLSNISNLKKLEMFAILLRELETINREERILYKKIMEAKYKVLPETLTKYEELKQIADSAKSLKTIIQNNMGKILIYNTAAVEVFFIDLKDKLPGVTAENWREISRIIIDLILRPRSLLEEYKLLAAELNILRQQAQKGGTYITQLKDLEKRLDRLTRRLKFLVHIHPSFQQEINIDNLSIENIISLYEEDKNKSIRERRLDAQHFIDIMHAVDPYKVITSEDLTVIALGELDKNPSINVNNCMKELLDFMLIRSPFKFVRADIAVEPLASLQRKLADIPGVKISAEEIFQALQNPTFNLLVADSVMPQDPFIELAKDEKLDDYIAPLEEMTKAIRINILKLFALIDINQAKLKAATDAQERLKITAFTELHEKLAEKQLALQSKFEYLVQRKLEIINQLRFLSCRYCVMAKEAEHYGQRNDIYVVMLTQLIATLSSNPKVAVPVIDFSAAQQKKEASLRENFFVGIIEKEAEVRRAVLGKFETITENEYTNLLHNAVKLEGIERRIEIVTYLRKKLEEKYSDLDQMDIDVDVELQQDIFQQVIAALRIGFMTTSELETFFLGMAPDTKLIVFTGNEGDENRTVQFRTLPIQNSRAFFLAMVKAQARNAWFAANMAQLDNPPEQLIAKHFTSEEINKMLRLPAFHGISNFNPLNEEQNTAIALIIKTLIANGVGQYFAQEPDLRKSYFLLLLEDMIGRKIISNDPPYMFTLPEKFGSAYQVAIAIAAAPAPAPAPILVEPIPEVVVQDAAAPLPVNDKSPVVAAKGHGGYYPKGLLTPVKKQLVRDLREGAARLQGNVINFDGEQIEHQIDEIESRLKNEVSDMQDILKRRQDIMQQIEAQRAEDILRKQAEAKLQAEANTRREAEARLQAEEHARREATARLQAEENARREAAARLQAEESARREAAARSQAEAVRAHEEQIRQQQLQAEHAKAQAALAAAQQQILIQQQAVVTAVNLKPAIIAAAKTSAALLSQYFKTKQEAKRFLQENGYSLGTTGVDNFAILMRILP